jgi:hypothetical protein
MQNSPRNARNLDLIMKKSSVDVKEGKGFNDNNFEQSRTSSRFFNAVNQHRKTPEISEHNTRVRRSLRTRSINRGVLN